MPKSRVANHVVVECWRKNKPAKNHKQTFWTTGKKLFSYDLLIGDTTDNGIKVLKDYTAQGRHGFQSQTTSCHVGLARVHADLIS